MMFYRQAVVFLAAVAVALFVCTGEAFQLHHQALVPRRLGNIATKPAFLLFAQVEDNSGDEPTAAAAIGEEEEPKEGEETKKKRRNPLKGFFQRIFRRNKKVKQDIKAKAQAIKTKAIDGLMELEDRLEAAIQKETDEIINAIALDCIELLNGHWDLAIATNREETKSMMEGSIEELADDLIEWGVADTSEKSLLQHDLANSRLKITQTIDASDYPLRFKHEVTYGTYQSAIQLYGQFQFDLLEHEALYSLDELVVLGTKVDLEEIINMAASAAAEEDEKEEKEETSSAVASSEVQPDDDDAQKELMEEIASTLEAEKRAEETTIVEEISSIDLEQEDIN